MSDEEVETPEGSAPPLADEPILGDVANPETIEPPPDHIGASASIGYESEAEAEEAQREEPIRDGGMEGGV